MQAPTRQLTAKERLIVALDTSTIDEARRLIDELYEYVGVFKVGLEFLMSEGSPALEKLQQERELKVFFDGKFHDIPNTVAKASEAVARRRVAMFTVHASGGRKMLEAARQACLKVEKENGIASPIVLAVTVLTSLSQEMLNHELNVPGQVGEQVVKLGKLSKDSGVNGLVASAHELSLLRKQLGPEMILVSPGIRPAGSSADDQSRIVTPAQALKDGADYLVVGRPIIAASDRKSAAQRIVEEMQEALA